MKQSGLNTNNHRLRLVLSVLLFAFAASGIAAAGAPMVAIGPDGTLIYAKDARGNRIPDFSRCGYMGGGVTLPTPAVVLFYSLGTNSI